MRGQGTRRVFLAGLVCLLLAGWSPLVSGADQLQNGTAVPSPADTGTEIADARRLLEAGQFERARALSRAGKLEEAAVEGEIALQTLERDDASLLPAAHAFMARTYFALRRTTEARVHQAWIEEHAETGPHR